MKNKTADWCDEAPSPLPGLASQRNTYSNDGGNAMLPLEHAQKLKIGILAHHHSQLRLCARLERLADTLPDQYDKQECLSLAWQVYPTIRSAHKFEEEQLFPLLLMPAEDGKELEKSLERLKFEHWEDEATAEDLSVFLKELVVSPKPQILERLPYVLRGLFEGMRRHIAFETEHLLPKLEWLLQSSAGR